MESRHQIKEWLRDFDSVINEAALDPAGVKKSPFLRRAFELAFPPADLPTRLQFKLDEEASAFDEIASAHRPYYTSRTIVKRVSN